MKKENVSKRVRHFRGEEFQKTQNELVSIAFMSLGFKDLKTYIECLDLLLTEGETYAPNKTAQKREYLLELKALAAKVLEMQTQAEHFFSNAKQYLQPSSVSIATK